MPGYEGPDRSGRPTDVEKMRTLLLLCDWLENNAADGLYRLEELGKQMITISECKVVYSMKQMKNLLMERYGENICISEVCRCKCAVL